MTGVIAVAAVLSLTACGDGGGGGGSGSTPTAKAWGTAQLIEISNAGSARHTQIAVDGSGNALAVWQQSDGTRTNIWANRYSAATGAWGTAQLIETDNNGSAVSPQIAIDGSGNAITVWWQSDGTRTNIWANHFSAGSGWGTAQLIEADNASSAGNPQIAIDASGNAIAVWWQSDGPNYSIWTNRYNAATGAWGTAALIETDNTGFASFPQIALDDSGNALAVWQQYDGTNYSIWANRYSAATGAWGTAALIESDDVGAARDPQIAIDGSGNAIAVWQQFDGTNYSIWANRYTATTGAWGTAALIETDNAGSAGNPQIAFDGSGNALAVWQQYDSTLLANIWANRYTAATNTWGTAALIESNDVGSAVSPQIGIDGSGNALAVWQQYDGANYSIWANRYE